MSTDCPWVRYNTPAIIPKRAHRRGAKVTTSIKHAKVVDTKAFMLSHEEKCVIHAHRFGDVSISH